MNNASLIKIYIKSLIKNINTKEIPKEIDISFDSGAFNGMYSLGCAYYLKVMEELKYLKVKRVSGASIGAWIALIYLTNADINSDDIFKDVSKYFKKNCNFKIYKNIIKNFIDKNVDNIDKLNDRLYISYYDINNFELKTISKFKNKEHLYECIIRSSHIPYIMNGKCYYKKRYIDGLMPYIFTDNIRPNLFIKLITYKKIIKAIKFNEENSQHRIINGIVDINNFFMDGDSDMCSYTNNWSYYYIIERYVREIFIINILKFINLIIVLYTQVPLSIKNNNTYIKILSITKNLIKDIYFIL
jgi:hypothetical protein